MRAAWLALAAAAAASPVWAQPLSREDLLQELKARDAAIARLEARIAVLEGQRSTPPILTTSPPATRAPTGRASAEAGDEDVALQALSRALVERGGLLLPAGSVELAPGLAYSHTQVQGLALAPTPEGIPTVADQRLRNDSARATAVLRVGLPWRSQFEVRAPYVWTRQARSLGSGVHAANEGSGFGDLEMGLSHQFLRERGWRPDLVGGLDFRFATGRDPFRTRIASIATGAGTDQVKARFTAVKSSDPLVFFSTLSYAHDLARHETFGRVEPGDQIGLQLGGLLAVSPETSLTFGVAQEFRAKTRIDGSSIPGSDGVAATLLLGFDRVLSPNVLLDISLGVGLTRDAPDYVLQITTPIRFR